MKRFLLSIALVFAIVFGYNFISYQYSYAANSVTVNSYTTAYNMYEKFRYTGAYPTSSDSVTIKLALSEVSTPELSRVPYSRIFNNATAGDITLHFCSAEGVAYETSLSADTYTVTDTIPNVKSLTYTDTNMSITLAGNFTGDLVLNYYGTVAEDGDTYDTAVGQYTLQVSNVGTYYVAGYNGRVTIEEEDVATYTFDENFAKSYVLGYYNNGVITSKDNYDYGVTQRVGETDDYIVTIEGAINPTLFNTDQHIYMYTQDGDNSTIVGSINVYLHQEIIIPDSITPFIEGEDVSGTTTESRKSLAIEAGETISGSVQTTNNLNDIEVACVGHDNFVVSGGPKYENKGDLTPTGYTFTLYQRTMALGTFNFSLKFTDTSSGYEEYVYLTIAVSTTTPPVITLYATEREFEKNENLEYIESEIKANIQYVTLFDGTTLDATALEGSSYLTITYSTIDTTAAGEYLVKYEYNHLLSGLSGEAEFTIRIIDQSPAIVDIECRTVADNSRVNPGAKVPLGTEIYFLVVGSDPDSTILTYNALSSKGTIIQDQTQKEKFTFTPSNSIAGEITFTFTVSDGYSSSVIDENSIYKVIFEDITPPTIILSEDVVYDEDTQTYSLNIKRGQTVYFIPLVEDCYDNSASLDRNDVIITAVGFTFGDEALKRYTFNDIGSYAVKYEAVDLSENKTTITVNVVVQNIAPTGQHKEYTFEYNDTINFNLYSLASDDAPGYEFINSGVFVTDENANNLVTDQFSFGTNGSVTIKLHKIYSEEQERDIPYIGQAFIKYKVVDSDGAQSGEYIVTINIFDETAPVITAVQAKPTNFIINKGNTFTKEGYFTAIDEVEGEIEPTSIKIYQNEQEKQSINFQAFGEYDIVYIFKDSKGNQSSATVTIKVVAGGKPTLELFSSKTTIQIGGKFDIYDAILRISDDEDGVITDKAVFKQLRSEGYLNIDDSAVNTNKAGEYKIRIFYIDKDGNSSGEKTFTLVVEEEKEFPMLVVYIGAGAVGLVLAIVVIRVIVIKRRMRI